MSDVIYKYGPFEYNEPVEFIGTPVHVGYQDDPFAPHPRYEVYLWCRVNKGVDEDNKKKAVIVATGESYLGKYIGTAVMPSGLVWHVIEV